MIPRKPLNYRDLGPWRVAARLGRVGDPVAITESI